MASGWTNRGKFLILDSYFRDQNEPASFEVHLVTSATAPDADTNILTDLTEIADGNGYTQTTGYALARNTTDFDAPMEFDAIRTISTARRYWHPMACVACGLDAEPQATAGNSRDLETTGVVSGARLVRGQWNPKVEPTVPSPASG